MRIDYEILSAISPHITKKQIQGGHKIISAAERLTPTLCFLATGETFKSLHYQFRIGRATIPYIIKEVCQVIFQVLGPVYLKKFHPVRKNGRNLPKNLKRKGSTPTALVPSTGNTSSCVHHPVLVRLTPTTSVHIPWC